MSLAYTSIADIIDPEVLQDQISAKFPDMLVLGNSNLVETNPGLQGTPGTVVKMPFWKRIGTFASLVEGTAMTPGKVTASAEYAVIQRAGLSLEVYDTAELVSKSDPMAEISNQLSRRAAEYLDAALVTELEKTPNTYDGTGDELDQNVLITAVVATLGDNYGKLVGSGAVIMHSKVWADLVKTGAIQNQYQSGFNVIATGTIPTLMGLPIIVSDGVTVTAASSDDPAYYQTYVVGPGALGLFYQRGVKVEFDRDILMQADIVASTVHFAPHLYGWDDSGNKQACEDAKSIHVVNIKTK